MNKMGSVPAAGRAGVSVMPLFEDHRETVQLESWAPGASVEINASEGAELLVIEGGFATDKNETLRKESWLRIPLRERLKATAGPAGAKVWIKTRHLRFVDAPGAS